MHNQFSAKHAQAHSNKDEHQKRSQKLGLKPQSLPAGGKCEYCGTTYSATAQICPECGMGISRGNCTFCGKPIPHGEADCPHCGNPSDGLECPECGTINFRNFCRKCGAALNSRAQYAVARYREAPEYKKAEAIAQELEQLDKVIKEKSNGRNFAEVLHATAQATAPKVKPAPETRKKTNFNVLTLDEAEKMYEEKQAEMEAVLDSIVPPPDMTPEEQRDFCSARKIVVKYTTVIKKTVNKAWICNYCGFRHNSPSECAEPWHGGTWITDEVTQTIEETKLETLNRNGRNS